MIFRWHNRALFGFIDANSCSNVVCYFLIIAIVNNIFRTKDYEVTIIDRDVTQLAEGD